MMADILALGPDDLFFQEPIYRLLDLKGLKIDEERLI